MTQFYKKSVACLLIAFGVGGNLPSIRLNGLTVPFGEIQRGFLFWFAILKKYSLLSEPLTEKFRPEDSLKTAADIAVNLPITVSKTNTLRLNGKILRPENLIMEVIRALPSSDAEAFKSALNGPLESYETASKLVAEIAVAHRRKKSAEYPSTQELENTFISKACATPMSRLQIIHVWSEDDQVRLLDPSSGEFSTCSHKLAWSNACKALGKETAEQWWAKHLVECQRTQYHPHRPMIYSEGHETLWNPYRKPTWLDGWSPPTGSPTCPQLLREFLELFTPDKKDRVLIAAWLRDMTFDMAGPVLVLAGAPGVGKNLLVQNLGGALVGEGNASTASRGFKTSRFTGEISGKRLFFYDEMVLDAEMRELYKSLHNRSAAIERKYSNVQGSEELFCSLVIANNFPQKIELEYSDRKFYVPRLSETPILESWGQEKIDQFIAATESDVFLKEVASYLYSKFKPGQSNKFGKSETFRKLCLNQYPLYFQRIVGLKGSEQMILGSKFNKHYKSRIDGDKLREYVSHYELQFKEKLGVVEGYGSKWVLTYDGAEDSYPNGAAVDGLRV